MSFENKALLCDFYELTMMYGYFKNNLLNDYVCFEVFYRSNPDHGGYSIMAGLENILNYIKELRFSSSDITFLRSKKIFDEKFLNYLSSYKFTGNIKSMREGEVIFPNEPVMSIYANPIDAQLIETYILLCINHQSLIATKASRIVRAADGRMVIELGARRAQGESGAVMGARAAYIGGCDGSSCTLSDKLFDVPSVGTMAHSWVQMFDTEYEAFKAYCELYNDNITLLVDTYNVLKSGIPNAIKVLREYIVFKGIKNYAVRIDSGDIAYLSKESRKMLDKAGLFNCKIVVSNSLDEYLIRDLILQGAKVDIFGVGERLITSKSSPVFGGVYKLCYLNKNGCSIPKIKLSENASKTTNPGIKEVYRFYDENNKAVADYISLIDEVIEDNKEIHLFDVQNPWQNKKIKPNKIRKMLIPVIVNGDVIYDFPSVDEIRKYSKNELDCFWDEIKRFENPHNYIVDLSLNLYNLKVEMINKIKNK